MDSPKSSALNRPFGKVDPSLLHVPALDLTEIYNQVPRARKYTATKPNNAWSDRYSHDVPRLLDEIVRLRFLHHLDHQLATHWQSEAEKFEGMWRMECDDSASKASYLREKNEIIKAYAGPKGMTPEDVAFALSKIGQLEKDLDDCAGQEARTLWRQREERENA
jgi:hypothetical protein